MYSNKQITKTEDQARVALAALCARGEHCTGEMDDKMRRWGLDDAARQRVVDYLVDNHFVDDERFSRAFVNDKLRYDHWGRRKIEQGLWQKKVAPSLVERVLAEVPAERYADVLLPLMQSKWPTIKAETDYERSMKLIKWALGRGFDMDVIRRCIERMGEVEDVDLT